ncbi:hypothetical protein AO057_03775 [Curvibacter sp. PAE-UM]|nr:hypothetical protein AO057_03775 [Curvibacter sp. PAE-UM]
MGYRDSALVLLLAFPWLNPWAFGPSPSVLSWQVSLGCGVLLWLCRHQLSANIIFMGWVLAAVVSAVIGLLQYAGWAHGLDPWFIYAPAGEAYGNLRQKNQFATLTNIGLAAVIGLSMKVTTANKMLKTGLILATLVLAAANAASASRTGLLQLIMLAGMVAVWGQWRQAEQGRLLIGGLLAYVATSMLLPLFAGNEASTLGVWSRLRTAEDACTSRLALWSNVMHLIPARPWTGWGWGELDYAHFITLYPGVRFCEILDNAHNLPMHLSAELGVPVALLLCGLGLWLVWRARPWREMNADRQVAWSVLGLILLHSMLEYPLWFGPFQLAALLSVWVLVRKAELSSNTAARLSWKMRDLVLAAGALTGLGYSAWDYHRVSQIFYPPDFRAAAYRDNTLEKIRGTWLFQDQVQFAEFTLTPLTPGNAEHLYEMGQRVLHYSPEARVVEKLIECAVLLGRDEAAHFYLARYKAAFPKEHARWAARQLEPVKPH